jgi:hypothetical protein
MSEQVPRAAVLPQEHTATNLAAFFKGLPVRARQAGPAQRWGVALWTGLVLATVAALCSTTYRPFYDYYQWLYQGHVVSVLLFGTATDTGAGAGVSAGTYILSPVPVPNLAAPVLIGLLNVMLPIEAAGTVFLVLTALGFALAFAHLARTLQRRPTAVEFLGFPWAMGFFLYKGYLSFEFGVAAMFVLVAVLHRAVRRPRSGPWIASLVAVTGLGLLLYLSHLLAWVMGGLAVVLYALVLARRGERWTALQLVLCLCPGIALAVWYVLAEHSGTGITLYSSWQAKAIALTESFQFFLRLDPFPPAFPLFWINALLAVAFAALVLLPIDLPRCRRAITTRPVLWLSTVLAALALVLPISIVNELIKPDERFVAPALLLAIAALPYHPTGRRVQALGAGLAAIVIGLHFVEYTDVGTRIQRIDAAIDAHVPDQGRVLHLTVTSRYGCAPSTGPVTGVPVLKWFAIDHTLEGGPAGINIEETSLVHARDPTRLDTTVLDLDAPDIPTADLPTADLPAADLPTGFAYPYIEAIACPSDLAQIAQKIAADYRPVAHGDTYTIFQRR